MSPQNGALTESEIRRYGALSGECPVELAGEVIGGLFDLLRSAEGRLAAADTEDRRGTCSCRPNG